MYPARRVHRVRVIHVLLHPSARGQDAVVILARADFLLRALDVLAHLDLPVGGLHGRPVVTLGRPVT